MRLTLLPLVLLASGCDYSGDFLFPGVVDNVPGVLIIPTEDGGSVHEPAIITNYELVQESTIYFELGPTGTAALGGATLDFAGTGDRVCVWVDPEMATWNQAIREGLDPFLRPFSYPDNIFDDGDIDVIGGRSVFYTGSPGVAMGDFVLQYEDDLGNEVPISFVECTPAQSQFDSPNSHAGKGTAEYCEFATTELGVTYTVALQTWSTPLDDDRVGVGVLLAQGSCRDIIGYADAELTFNQGTVDQQQLECIIRGESIKPDAGHAGPWYGYDAISSWENSVEFENSYCFIQDSVKLDEFCDAEIAGLIGLSDEELEELAELEAAAEDDENDTRYAEELDRLAAEHECEWRGAPEEDNRCFCGDPDDTPQQGAG